MLEFLIGCLVVAGLLSFPAGRFILMCVAAVGAFLLTMAYVNA